MTDDHARTPITRETLANGVIARMASERDGDDTIVVSEEALIESRRALLPDNADCSDLWVFGYGSLIFNPLIDYEATIKAKIFGYHRRFCLWTRVGRGSPDCPGLVLALDRGGSCAGLAFKLKPENAIAELDLLWRREMLTLAYNPRLLHLHTDEGIKTGISFTSNPNRPVYAEKMTLDQQADVIANAVGFIGPCHEYLYDTVSGLASLDISDPYLEKLVIAVQQRLAL